MNSTRALLLHFLCTVHILVDYYHLVLLRSLSVLGQTGLHKQEILLRYIVDRLHYFNFATLHEGRNPRTALTILGSSCNFNPATIRSSKFIFFHSHNSDKVEDRLNNMGHSAGALMKRRKYDEFNRAKNLTDKRGSLVFRRKVTILEWPGSRFAVRFAPA